MTYDPKKHHRRSIRWFAYDYTQAGAYFVTICTADRQGPLGRVEGAQVRLSRHGLIAEACWWAIPEHCDQVELDAFVVMPNHVHGILLLWDVGARHALPSPTDANRPPVGQATRPKRTSRRSLGSIVGAYKSAVSRRINNVRGTPGRALWQRNFYEHVIRNAQQLTRIRRYIDDNPANWPLDHENPQANCYGQNDKQQSFCY